MQYSHTVQDIWNPRTQSWETVPESPQTTHNRPNYQPDWRTNIRRTVPLSAADAFLPGDDTMPLDATEYHRERPRAAANIDNRVYIPGIIAAFGGVLAFPIATGLLHAASYDTMYAFPCACAFALGLFLVGISQGNRLLFVAETAFNTDLDGDGEVGEPDPAPDPAPVEAEFQRPEPETRRIDIDLRHNSTHSQYYGFDIPTAIEEKLPAVAHAIKLGVSFSRPQLVDRRKLLSQSEFRQLKRILEKAGFVEPMEGNKTRVTPAGRSFLANYLD